MSGDASHERDRVVPLESVPRPSASEPELFIAGSERCVAVSFRMDGSDAGEYGAPLDEEPPFCVLLFAHSSSHGHTREAVAAHPLSTNGLLENCVQEVLNSTAIIEPSCTEPTAAIGRHFVIAFKDSTFECIAEDCFVAGLYGSGDVAAREAFVLCR
jgi:hypothetical protein